MPTSTRLNKAEHACLMRLLAKLESSTKKRQTWLVEWHDVYKMPSRAYNRNIALYKRVLKALETLQEIQYQEL